MKPNSLSPYIRIPDNAPSLMRAQLVAHAYIQASRGESVFLHDKARQEEEQVYVR